jgi:radical SAM superfamily enzyme YgiQ (UPF0313 family)
MKILLIRPKPDSRTIGLQHVMVVEPLELLYVGSVLKPHHDVKLYDMILEKLSLEAILEEEQPDAVAMSGYIAHVQVIKDYAQRVKAYFENSQKPLVIVGGVHAEVLAEDFLHPSIDYILASNGLENIVHITNGSVPKGIIRGGKLFNPTPPLPARELCERYQHQYYYMFHRPCHLIKTSYGCPYHCSFCFCKEITDGQYVQRTVEGVLDELQTLPHEEVYIVDDDFLFDAQRLEEFIHGVKARKLNKRYLVYGRADFIAKHPELMAKLKDIGLRAVIVGLESCSDEELKTYDKSSSTDHSITALAVLRALDIDCYGTFIVGLDWDQNDFRALKKFIIEQKLQFVNLQPLTPMPGTPLYDIYEKQLWVKREDYYLWDMAHAVVKPSKLSLRVYYYEIVKLYYATTVRPSMILRALSRYPLRDNLVLFLGANRVMLQYWFRILRGKP